MRGFESGKKHLYTPIQVMRMGDDQVREVYRIGSAKIPVGVRKICEK